MEFESDERKREQIVAERALDFVAAHRFFDGRPVSSQPTSRMDEERWKTTALIEGFHLTLVWCWRGRENPRDYNEASA